MVVGKAVLSLEHIGLALWFPWQPIASIGLYWGKCCEQASAFIFDWVFFILADYEDNHNISDKFEFGPDSTKDSGVSCP